MAVAQSPRQKAVVRSKDEQDNITIHLELAGRLRQMNRPKNELLEKCLARIKANAAPAPARRKDKRKANAVAEDARAPSQDMFVGLFSSPDGSSGALEPGLTNEQAWVAAKLLQVGDVLYDVDYNPPTVEKVVVQQWPMVGFPLLASATVAFADPGSSRWRWMRCRSGDVWEDVGTSTPLYTPTADDVGCVLRAECTPIRASVGPGGDGSSMDVDGLHEGECVFGTAGPVRQAPSLTAAALRCPNGPLPPAASPTFRIVSYNILASQYSDTDYAKNVLFSCCPTELLSVEYRHQLVLQELQHYNADVICLQEVDGSEFEELLLPQLRLAGYDGHYTNKQGKVREGSATFYRTSRFKLVGSSAVLLRDCFADPLPDHLSVFQPMLDASPKLKFALQQVGTIGQVSLLVPLDTASSAEGPLCVINTHLFFHPLAPHIRNMHAYAIVKTALRFLEAHSSRHPGATVLFAGDLNSDLNDGIPGVVELLSTGKLAANFWDWAYGAAFSWGKEDEEQEGEHRHADMDAAAAAAAASLAVTGVDLELPVVLRSSDDLRTPFTNYTSGYKALLDYVWHDGSRLSAATAVPQPTEQQVASFLPSPVFPSDHLAVVYDLTWREKGATASDAVFHTGVTRPVPAAQEVLPAVVAALQQSHVVALPTDTLYGLAADAASAGGVMRIYGIKNRNLKVPLAICVADLPEVGRYGDISHLPPGLVEEFLPGCYTLLLPRRADSPLCYQLNPGFKTIGIRIPDHEFIRSVCRHFGAAIALTSANISGSGSTLAVEEFEALWPRCAVVADGGRIQGSSLKGSTVIELAEPGQYRVVRQGDGYDRAVELLTGKYGFKDAAAGVKT